jgi:hypothetical protein
VLLLSGAQAINSYLPRVRYTPPQLFQQALFLQTF